MKLDYCERGLDECYDCRCLCAPTAKYRRLCKLAKAQGGGISYEQWADNRRRVANEQAAQTALFAVAAVSAIGYILTII